MNLSSVNGQTAMFGQISTTKAGNKPNMPIKESERTAVSNKTQEEASNKQTTPSIVIDEQAIVSFKENQALQSTFVQTKNETFSSANQDQPSIKNATAVANYQAVGNLAQRESVQKLFGVDIFA